MVYIDAQYDNVDKTSLIMLSEYMIRKTININLSGQLNRLSGRLLRSPRSRAPVRSSGGQVD
jgi:hypothetical protein